ncbi:hypothetical protein HDU76_002670, partial [Blyttiomyces sp. JEL0837]
LIPILKESGVSAVTLHGRSKEQRYTKNADWDYINDCGKVAGDLPLIGNGDILSLQDYDAHMSDPNNRVSSVMIGRGALIKPWIFDEIKNRIVDRDISAKERLEMFAKYARYGMEHWGCDTQGINTTRKYMLEWMSFTHRYIPTGLLEVLPQKFNERPPLYMGRNDDETLLASPNVSDWIKVTEKFLGKAPDNFHFVPKHKSNSYDSEAGIEANG